MIYLILGPYNLIFQNNQFINYENNLQIEGLIILKKEFMNYKYFFQHPIKKIYLQTTTFTENIIDFKKFYLLIKIDEVIILPKIPSNNTLSIITEKEFYKYIPIFYRNYKGNLLIRFICYLRKIENFIKFLVLILLIYILCLLFF
ncbi:hypothetical protein AB836_00545 [Rickettsiales bacterium (ex Bugula neritina AB1)]|nr:hypothetical protein AB836_00545 [Rickettsiales bacterium (ex Bugula neritina AB1)]